MLIYINNVLQKTEILPTFTPTLDETLETFSFGLIANDDPIPKKPMSSVEVVFDNTHLYFYIVSDSVETYSLKPLKYKHSITCIQNTRILSKHLVRNSVFTQPAQITKKSYNAESQYGDVYSKNAAMNFGNPNSGAVNWSSETLTLTSKEKLTNARLKISFQYIRRSRIEGTTGIVTPDAILDAHTVDQIKDAIPTIGTLTIPDRLTLKYTINGAPGSVVLSPSDFGASYFDLNKTYRLPQVEQLRNIDGANDFEIQFDSLNFLQGTFNDFEDEPIAAAFGNPSQYPYIMFYMVQIQIIADTYYYTARDILELLIERQKKETSLGTHVNQLFFLPEDNDNYTDNQRELARLLDSTIAPNFTFTQLTMYECVAEVFRLFDAIFTMDGNRVLGIEYFNDLSKGEIPEANAKFSGRTLAWGEDKYTNGLVAYYQDGRYIEKFPKNGDWMYLRSVEFGVPEAQDHSFILPHNIKGIVKCEILSPYIHSTAGNSTSHFDVEANIPIDITDYVVEESVWSALDKGAMTGNGYDDYVTRKLKQANSVYYHENDNKIQVAYSFKNSWNLNGSNYSLYQAALTCLLRMSGTNNYSELYPDTDLKGQWGSIRMRVTYIASVDGVEKVHSLEKKYDGETLVDQSNGAVDLNKMGLNMLGLVTKLGNPTLNATHKITTWDNRIKVGQTYSYKDSIWVANVVSYTFENGYLQGKVSFVKNYNELSLRTELLREKRMTNISKSLIQKSEDIITDFVYFSTQTIPFDGDQIQFNNSYFRQFLLDSFKSSGSYSKLGDACVYRDPQDITATRVWGKYIPLVTYGSGNTINFEMSMEHPISAGNQTEVTTTWGGFTLQSEKYFTKHIIYTDVYYDKWNNLVTDGFLDEVQVIAPASAIGLNLFPDIYMDLNPSLHGALRGERECAAALLRADHGDIQAPGVHERLLRPGPPHHLQDHGHPALLYAGADPGQR